MRSLEYQGVETIFGYPGGSIMPVFDALYDHRNTLNHILVRHEQGAAHAAQGFARSSGEVGVCLVTSGPGATNTITGIADAMIDSTPIVVIAGQVGTAFLGTDAFQEVDLVGITQPITKWSYRHSAIYFFFFIFSFNVFDSLPISKACCQYFKAPSTSPVI